MGSPPKVTSGISSTAANRTERAHAPALVLTLAPRRVAAAGLVRGSATELTNSVCRLLRLPRHTRGIALGIVLGIAPADQSLNGG